MSFRWGECVKPIFSLKSLFATMWLNRTIVWNMVKRMLMSHRYRLKVESGGEGSVFGFETPTLDALAWHSYIRPEKSPMGAIYELLQRVSEQGDVARLSLVSDEKESDVWKIENPAMLQSQDFQHPHFLVNLTKKEFVNLWLAIEESSSRNGYIDPLAMLVSQGGNKNQGIWLGDSLYLSDTVPLGYNEIFVSYLVGEEDSKFTYEIVEEIRENAPLWKKTTGHEGVAPVEVFQNLCRALYGVGHSLAVDLFKPFTPSLLNWVETHHLIVPIYSNKTRLSLVEDGYFTGYACLSKEDAKTHYGATRFTKKLEKRCMERLEEELNQETLKESVYVAKLFDRNGRVVNTYGGFKDKEVLENWLKRNFF